MFNVALLMEYATDKSPTPSTSSSEPRLELTYTILFSWPFRTRGRNARTTWMGAIALMLISSASSAMSLQVADQLEAWGEAAADAVHFSEWVCWQAVHSGVVDKIVQPVRQEFGRLLCGMLDLGGVEQVEDDEQQTAWILGPQSLQGMCCVNVASARDDRVFGLLELGTCMAESRYAGTLPTLTTTHQSLH